jgi:hypothetical protein
MIAALKCAADVIVAAVAISLGLVDPDRLLAMADAPQPGRHRAPAR